MENEEEEAVASGASDEVHSFTRYPSFGSSSTPFADDDGYLGYGAYVKDFYNAWMTFSSAKSFQWADKWRLSEAPNRFVKRAMEKENKKARDTAKKEYNDTVRVSQYIYSTMYLTFNINFCYRTEFGGFRSKA